MKAAVIQLCSQDDVGANLDRARRLVLDATSAGARLVALPENFAFMGEEARKIELAECISAGPEQERADSISAFLSDLARNAHVWLVAGGLPEKSHDPVRPYNTSLLFAPDGRVAARYRKIHLFDVDLADGTSHRESASTSAGEEPVVSAVEVEGGEPFGLGMTICYDLRFPELYRCLGVKGARVVSVPAAFTLTTGKDHWRTLLRARAIENQIFVLAPAQHGRHPRGRQTYGKSLIVDPWGDVLAQCPEGEGFAVARLEFAAQDRVRASLPCLSHRRL